MCAALERDERDDVGDSDARMYSDVLAEVDELDGERMPASSDSTSPSSAPTSVNTERWWSPSEWMSSSVASRSNASPIAATTSGVPRLGDVGHGLEHDPYPTKPSGWGDRNRLEPTFGLVMRGVGECERQEPPATDSET